jgi:hypothetical protein
MMSESEIRDMARLIMAENKTGNSDYKFCLGMISGFATVLGYNGTVEFVASLKVA